MGMSDIGILDKIWAKQRFLLTERSSSYAGAMSSKKEKNLRGGREAVPAVTGAYPEIQGPLAPGNAPVYPPRSWASASKTPETVLH
jgi:hypothetical protein